MKTQGTLGLGAIGGMLTILIVGLLTRPGYSESRPAGARPEVKAGSTKPVLFDARQEARYFMRDVLTAPNSAEFVNEKAEQGEDGSWLVQGEVDALNSYGTVARSAYLCRFRKFDATHWELSEPCEVMGQ